MKNILYECSQFFIAYFAAVFFFLATLSSERNLISQQIKKEQLFNLICIFLTIECKQIIQYTRTSYFRFKWTHSLSSNRSSSQTFLGLDWGVWNQTWGVFRWGVKTTWLLLSIQRVTLVIFVSLVIFFFQILIWSVRTSTSSLLRLKILNTKIFRKVKILLRAFLRVAVYDGSVDQRSGDPVEGWSNSAALGRDHPHLITN